MTKTTNDPVEEYRRTWGVPDWRDASSYPTTSTDTQWRWEFLRRREDYRSDYEKYSAVTARRYHNKSGADLFKLLAESGQISLTNFSCGPGDLGFHAEMPGSWEKYRLGSLPNPRFSEACPSFAAPGNTGYIEPGALHFGSDHHPIVRRIHGGHIAVVFDMSASIPKQIQAAKSGLLYWQKNLRECANPVIKATHSARDHRDKWQTYLRALDAEVAGATAGEIFRAIHPRSRTHNARARVAEIVEAAHTLQDRITERTK